MTSPPVRNRSSVVLLVVVLVALAIGGAASLVAGSASAAPFHSGRYSEFTVSFGEFEAVLFGLLALGAGLAIWVRLGSSNQAIPGRFVAFALAALVAGVVLAVLLGAVGSGAGGFFSNGPANSTGSAPSNPTNGTGTPLPGGSGGVLASLGFPPWALYVIVAAVVCVLAAVTLPSLWSRYGRSDRGAVARKRSAAEIEEVLAAASHDLAAGNDPREVILALYAALLRRVDPMIGGVDLQTPAEIEELHLTRLGVRPSAAAALTRLFEEARYSSHPIGPADADAARVAIDAARADLDRVPLAA